MYVPVSTFTAVNASMDSFLSFLKCGKKYVRMHWEGGGDCLGPEIEKILKNSQVQDSSKSGGLHHAFKFPSNLWESCSTFHFTCLLCFFVLTKHARVKAPTGIRI